MFSPWASSATPTSATPASTQLASDSVARQQSNLIKNGTSEDTATTDYEGAGLTINPAYAYQGSGYRVLTSSVSTNVNLQITPLMPCVEGERYYMEAMIRTGGSNHGGTGSAIVARFWNASKASVGSSAGNPVTVNTPWSKSSGEFTVPTGIGAVWISFELYTYTDPTGPHSILFDNLYAERTQSAVNQINSVDYLSNQDKIQLRRDWDAEQQIKTQLDANASALGVSSTSYDNAVAALSTNLIAAGAPSGWATSWPDGTTFSAISILTNLRSWWASIASARAALQKAIADKVQANAAYADALARSSNNLIRNGNSEDASPSSFEAAGVTTGNAYTGSKCRSVAGTVGNTYTPITAKLPCVPGDQFYAESWIKQSAGTGYSSLAWRVYDSNGSLLTSYITGTVNATSYTKSTGSCTIPANGASVEVCLATTAIGVGTTAYFDALYSCRMISPGMAQADMFQTSNYAEDGTGAPTAGAQMSAFGTALKVAPGNLQIGATILSDYLLPRMLQAIDGNATNGRTFYRGNTDVTVRAGTPNIGCLSVRRRRWDTTYKVCRLDLVIQPTNPNDNLDGMRYASVSLYRQSAAGTTGTLTSVDGFKVPIPDRLYYNVASDSDTGNGFWISFEAVDSGVSGGYPAALVSLSNAYGKSVDNCYYTSSTGTTDASFLVNNGQTWPAGLTGGSGGTGSSGGGGGGGACPAPWVGITLASGLEIHAGDLWDGAAVVGVDDTTAVPGVGIIRRPRRVWRERAAVILTDGRAPEFSLDHRFLTDAGWIPLRNLQPGDTILGPREGVVKAIGKPFLSEVVAFEVEGCHTYVSDGLMSHNLKLLE